MLKITVKLQTNCEKNYKPYVCTPGSNYNFKYKPKLLLEKLENMFNQVLN